jgi:hypothetical protein
LVAFCSMATDFLNISKAKRRVVKINQKGVLCVLICLEGKNVEVYEIFRVSQ